MNKTVVTLAPLEPEDRERFILDDPWAFRHVALEEFGVRDGHVDGEIIARRTRGFSSLMASTLNSSPVTWKEPSSIYASATTRTFVTGTRGAAQLFRQPSRGQEEGQHCRRV